MPRIRTDFPRNALLLLVLIFSPRATFGDSPPGQFLVISDLHFDPFQNPAIFAQLVAKPIAEWGSILAAEQPFRASAHGMDSNYALITGGLDDAQKRIPEPDFFLCPGDFITHDWQDKYDRLAPRSRRADPALYQAFLAKTLQFLAGEYHRRFPNTPILPAPGNEDSDCGDYMIEPSGPFLRTLADAWEPLIGPGLDVPAFRESFRRGGYYTVPLPRAKDQRLVVLNSVLFSVNYSNACGSSTATPALDELDWLDRTLAQAHAAGVTVWLLMHSPPGVNGYESSATVARGDSPVSFWQPELTSKFLQLVERYRSTLRVAFAGHTHMDDFRVIKLGGEPVFLCKIVPAFSPLFGNNPVYQTYQYERATGEILNYQTYYLGGQPVDAPSAPAHWGFEYDFQKTYGATALTPGTVTQLAEAMKTTPALRQSFTTFYAVSAPLKISDPVFEIYRCAIANVTQGEFLTNLGGPLKAALPAAEGGNLKKGQ